MPLRNTAAIVSAAVIAAALGLGTGEARAQASMPMDHAAHHAAMAGSAVVPTMPGQDAFGSIQEIVRILEADPGTDWSKVDIEALRQHLVDMNKVTLEATVAAAPLAGGARFEVTGEGRTLEAIRRMVPAHGREIDGTNGWTAKTEPMTNGLALTVTATDPGQAARIRGLGFIGIMAQGNHHQMHHLAMAKGGFHH